MKAEALAILGTGSDVGKSVVTAGICRLLSRSGIHVAPFKAQNMSLNSFVTPEGLEIGRAQALQATACGIAPHVDMNPILLKPESDRCSQVVVLGKVFAKQEASVYFDGRRTLWSVVEDSYTRLASRYEMMVIEGAGSAAEVNLKKQDLVNWPVVKMADARVVLVADIDRGGVFAQILGTLDLLDLDERDRVCGIVVNKFRGDAELFADGVRFLESRSGVPVLGVIPYLRDLMLDQEDSLGHVMDQNTCFASDRVNIAIVLLPHMSNFTDFHILSAEEDVVMKYVRAPAMISDADIVIIPGSKSTVNDLSYLREKGFLPLLDRHLKEERELVGICGGYQMLGRTIMDPDWIEQGGTSTGLGYLNIETTLMNTKYTMQVEACPTSEFIPEGMVVRGYEVHMGDTRRMHEVPCFIVRRPTTQGPNIQPPTTTREEGFDGAVRRDGLVWGTYIHGVFDEPEFRRSWLNRVRRRKRLPPVEPFVSRAINARLRNELDRWADHLSHYSDLSHLLKKIRFLNASRER